MDASGVAALLKDLESERVERKASLSDKDKVCEAVCAFANDLSGRGQPGYVLVGARDDGSLSGVAITDELLQELSAIRSEGNLQPFPVMSVERVELGAGEALAVVTVQPSQSPPVRYRGRTWVRVGPTTRLATAEEERRLSERRVWGDLPFDHRGVLNAEVSELDTEYFVEEYLPNAVAPDVLADNARTVEEQLASLRFVTPDLAHPTNGGILVLGIDPLAWLPGAYVQFVRFDGV